MFGARALQCVDCFFRFNRVECIVWLRAEGSGIMASTAAIAIDSQTNDT